MKIWIAICIIFPIIWVAVYCLRYNQIHDIVDRITNALLKRILKKRKNYVIGSFIFFIFSELIPIIFTIVLCVMCHKWIVIVFAIEILIIEIFVIYSLYRTYY